MGSNKEFCRVLLQKTSSISYSLFKFIYKFGRFIQKNIKYCWKRKSFDDFNYLSVDLTQKQYMWIMIFIAIYNIGISIYAIFNRYTN